MRMQQESGKPTLRLIQGGASCEHAAPMSIDDAVQVLKQRLRQLPDDSVLSPVATLVLALAALAQ